MTKPLVQRRKLIPKHLTNVRALPSRIREWERKGRPADAERGRSIYASSVRELRALGVEFQESV